MLVLDPTIHELTINLIKISFFICFNIFLSIRFFVKMLSLFKVLCRRLALCHQKFVAVSILFIVMI